ncbi:MAG: LysM peptidoglycan-binding domain-containing protein [Thermodesulfobacteriota bacterium]
MKRLAVTALLLGTLALPACALKVPAAPAPSAKAPENAQAQAACPVPQAEGVVGLAEEGPQLPLVHDDAPFSAQEEQALSTELDLQFDIDDQDTEEVRLHFRYFTHSNSGRQLFANWLKRSELYLPHVRRVLAERGLPEDLAFLPFVESGYNPRAISRAGAAGMWQFMPFTGKKFGLNVGWWMDERLDPFKSTGAAADYLTKLYGDFDDWYLALAAYNAGEGRVLKALKSSGCEDFFDLSQKTTGKRKRGKVQYYLPKETRHYVPKFIAVLKIVRNLEELGFATPNWTRGSNLAEIQVRPRTDLQELARAVGMPWQEFKAYNAAYSDAGSHPNKPSSVYVPADMAEAAKSYQSGARFKEFAGYYSFYTVASGDSLSRIASRFNVPVDVIKHYNGKTNNFLKVGESLKIPGKAETRMTAAAIRDEGQDKTSKAQQEKARVLAKNRANYAVRDGDTLWSIAKKYNTSVATLAKANGLNPRDTLNSGQTLYIPDHGLAASRRSQEKAEEAKQLITYKVKQGDTLFSIAKRFGVSLSSLLAWNDSTDAQSIRPGDQLRVYLR